MILQWLGGLSLDDCHVWPDSVTDHSHAGSLWHEWLCSSVRQTVLRRDARYTQDPTTPYTLDPPTRYTLVPTTPYTLDPTT